MKRIALVRDENGYHEKYKPILEEYGYLVEVVDIWRADGMDYLLGEKWDGFIWWAKHTPRIRNLARKLLYYFEHVEKIKTYPSFRDYWHYDDKVAQHILFRKFEVPVPETVVFNREEDAMRYAEVAELPVICKAASGAGSSNVRLIAKKKDLARHVRKVFREGVKTRFKEDMQKDYIYLQKFIPGNTGDYRLVMYGPRLAVGFFRKNSEKNSFASGSGIYEGSKVTREMVEFVDLIHARMGNTIMSYDLLEDGEAFVVTEMSIIYGILKNKFYEQADWYSKKDGSWERTEPRSRHRSTIDALLTGWGWPFDGE
ncbi:MAG: hypothetical protein JW814_06015 [Candidatus Krumholzibacteriota bacterium]|nr:hypothetical protein [Candidatus Krumholzibacteriota bacterium]